MFGRKNAKMTVKARKGLALAAELTGDEVSNFRKDRQAIAMLYTALQDAGYEWVSAKAEWAKVHQTYEDLHLRFTVTCQMEDREDVNYMLLQSLSAGGFEVTKQQGEIVGFGDDQMAVLMIEVEK